MSTFSEHATSKGCDVQCETCMYVQITSIMWTRPSQGSQTVQFDRIGQTKQKKTIHVCTEIME